MQSAAKRTKRLTSERPRRGRGAWACTVLSLTLAAILGVARPAAASSLEKELANLLLDHPQIQAAAKNVEASHYNIAKSRAGFFPKVSTTSSVGPSIIDSPSTRQVGDGGDFTRTEIIGGVTVTQNLFNGFLTTSQVRAAAINKAIAQITLRTATQTAMFEAIQAYIDVLRQKRLLELARENEATIQRQLNLEDERVQRGSGVAVDVLQAKSRLQIAKERRVSIEGALQDAISRYAQVYNRAPKVDEMTDPVPPVELVPSELERAIEIALAENPSIANTGATVEANRERRNIVRAELFPSFDLVGKTNYEHNRNAEIGTRRDYSLVLQATWDLFTGFSTRAGQAQAAFEYAASKDNHRQAARKVTEQVRIAWQALLTARERLELLENAVNIASEVFDSRRKLREAGKETVINVLDAENEVNNAQINFTGAAYEERTSVYQLLLAMGRLNATSLNIVVE